MQVDWFTVSAQIVNFLILVFLLKHFLYQPVLKSMSMREQKITDRHRAAEKQLKSAENIAHLYVNKRKELISQRSQILDEAKEGAEKQRTILLDRLRNEIDEIRLDWQNELVKEQKSILREMGDIVGEKIIDISRQVLHDLADVKLEQQIVHQFLDRLDQLSDEEMKKLVCAAENDETVTVATAFEVSENDQRVIQKKLLSIHSNLKPNYRIRPEIVCGIAFETDEQIWAWNVDHYIDEISEAILAISADDGDPELGSA